MEKTELNIIVRTKKEIRFSHYKNVIRMFMVFYLSAFFLN